MAKSLSILFVTSEVIPFAKTGGLADVSAALPLALTELGHDVRIVVPKYGTVSERRNRIHEIKRLKDIPIMVAGEETMATVKSSQVVNSRAKVQVYLVTNDKYLEPVKGIYQNPTTGKDFPNNDERFIFFQKSVLETCIRLGWRPDVIHCNDWQTALIPVFLKELYAKDNFFAHTRVVFTMHNLAYQGSFPASTFEKTGLSPKLFAGNGLEHGGNINFMKAGIVYADAVSTVSPTYAKEILTPAHGFGLEGVLKKHKEKLFGIMNGVDTEIWGPETDKLIDTKYSRASLEGKFENKTALAAKFNMVADLDTPMVGMIGRMVAQKGYDLIVDAIDELAKAGIQLVIMGEGEKKYLAALEKAARKYKNIGLVPGYDEEMAHQIQAGSDMLLMPSQFEPCGLNQLYALAYGTVPIVHRTGGLADSIVDYNPKKGAGNGFAFTQYDTAGLLEALKRAIALYRDEEKWEALLQSIMEEDHSWKASAADYVEKMYRKP
ncbi:MAG: glycogen synthase GlgA [Bacteroidetes bacterium]|nr:glycogen synthase GlgA [Bacteroidota bacterium]